MLLLALLLLALTTILNARVATGAVAPAANSADMHDHSGEAEALRWLQLDAVSEAVHNFVEVQVMRVGALLDMPEGARVERHERERRQRAETAERAGQKQAKQAREAEVLARLHALEEAAYAQVAPLMQALSTGAGEAKDLKRFERRRELQLLTMEPTQLRERVGSFEWSQLMTSGILAEAPTPTLPHTRC